MYFNEGSDDGIFKLTFLWCREIRSEDFLTYFGMVTLIILSRKMMCILFEDRGSFTGGMMEVLLEGEE